MGVIAAHWSPFLREKDVADPSLILVVARNIVITILWLSSDDDAHLCDDGRTTWAEGALPLYSGLRLKTFNVSICL